jgi:CRISPR-associated protein (TIGR03984 family)
MNWKPALLHWSRLAGMCRKEGKMRELQPIYRIKNCMSEVEQDKCSPDELSAIVISDAVEVAEGYAVCWLHHAVLIGKIADGTIYFRNNELPDYSRHLLRMRIFNEERESHIWRSGTLCHYRKRHDSPGNTVEYVEAVQPLWGTKAEPDEASPNWSRLFEDRGIELFVPCTGPVLNEHKRLSIVTRNYIGDVSDIGQAGYVDCRFIKFNWAGGEL